MITNEQIKEAANHLECEVAVVMAVWKTFTNGRSFRPDGRCRISFEGQLFWKELLKIGINPLDHSEGNEDILHPQWNATSDFTLHCQDQYYLLNKARQINEEAALKATCWGVFHLAGFNYSVCGYNTVKDFVVSQHFEENQLSAFCRYLEQTYLHINLRNKDWRGFASGYNGPDYHKSHLAIRLRKGYHLHAEGTLAASTELMFT